ncbi:hypothetical protein [Corynebacterium otitidis]|uniref:hypothetical protein n=1 Tax=Corynebacterium otitidis TaxID=29321 RepID=UPI0019D6CB61|nr:hypothetical protein [Corynebacterium otitidis]
MTSQPDKPVWSYVAKAVLIAAVCFCVGVGVVAVIVGDLSDALRSYGGYIAVIAAVIPAVPQLFLYQRDRGAQ